MADVESESCVPSESAWLEAELTAAEGEVLRVGADILYGSNVDPVILRNAHVACMTLINNSRGMTFEIVQRSESPNDAWRNLDSHYRSKGSKEIIRLLNEVNGKTIQPGGGPFKFITEIDWLLADLNRLSDRSVTELRKCVIIVAGLSTDYHIECQMLSNNPTDLERADIE